MGPLGNLHYKYDRGTCDTIGGLAISCGSTGGLVGPLTSRVNRCACNLTKFLALEMSLFDNEDPAADFLSREQDIIGDVISTDQFEVINQSESMPVS